MGQAEGVSVKQTWVRWSTLVVALVGLLAVLPSVPASAAARTSVGVGAVRSLERAAPDARTKLVQSAPAWSGYTALVGDVTGTGGLI
jgi:hypothetical protein